MTCRQISGKNWIKNQQSCQLTAWMGAKKEVKNEPQISNLCAQGNKRTIIKHRENGNKSRFPGEI